MTLVNYELHFRNLPISASRARVAQEFPPDAHTTAFVVKDTCAFELMRSRTLGRALRRVSDSSGAVLVEFSSGVAEDHYDPSAVNGAILSLGATSPNNIRAC